MDYKFEELKKKLGVELAEYPNLVTEDLIRHCYISVKGKEGAEIEVPYYRLIDDAKTEELFKSNRSRADLYLADDDCVVEFKYHKKLASSTPCHTNNFGAVFGDMNRLSLLGNAHKILVYVFDTDMYNYYNSAQRCLELLKEKGEFLSKTIYERCKKNSFTEPAFSSFKTNEINKFSYKVNIICSHNYDKGIYLRIYEIMK